MTLLQKICSYGGGTRVHAFDIFCDALTRMKADSKGPNNKLYKNVIIFFSDEDNTGR